MYETLAIETFYFQFYIILVKTQILEHGSDFRDFHPFFPEAQNVNFFQRDDVFMFDVFSPLTEII